jgi:hypothetical protein
MQEWNGKQVKKHLILSLTIYLNGRFWISLPFYPLDNARMEWRTSRKTFDTFSYNLSEWKIVISIPFY